MATAGERWMIVKATASEKTNWGGFPVKGASLSDAVGKKYPAEACSTGGEEPEFYPQATYILGNSATALFLFSIAVNSQGLKFSAGGVELAIPQSLPPQDAN
jgi:hypothetical protein